MTLPKTFESVDHVESFMATPSRALKEDLASVDGDILVLGAGGKMGPTLARLAKNAAPSKRVIAVARFSEGDLRDRLEGFGVETVAADLLDEAKVAALPRCRNIVYMAGRKFGSTGSEELTWAMNTYVPALVARSFSESRIVALSTGCVYAFAPVETGSTEQAPLTPPGEYANSCLGRERLFEYFSKRHGTPGRLIRLNYAIDMRYGVLRDIAEKVRDGRPIDLSTGHVNVIWQGEANSQILRCLNHCTTPTAPINISGKTTSVRWIAQAFASRMGKEPVFEGCAAETGWVIDTAAAESLFGPHDISLECMIGWTADWVVRDMAALDKPTHYEVRDGAY